MSSAKSLQAGVRDCWLSFLDTNDNIAIGNNTTAIAAGDIRGSYPFVGIQSMPTSILEGEVVPVPGDDTTLGSFIFASAEPREFLMNFGQGDLELDALLQGTLVETVGNIKVGLGDPGNPVYPTVCLIVNSRAIKRNAGVSGQGEWAGMIYPVVQIQPLNRETFEGRTAGVFRYKGVAQAAFNHPWGVTLASAVNGNLSSFCFPFTSNYPLTMDAFRGNGVKASWVLNKTPVSVAETNAWVERVSLGISSVTPATKTVVASVAADNGRGDFLYGYSS